jgi:hypothetical protein
MDDADRTCPERFEVPPQVLALLQCAADASLEWANDNGGDSDNEIGAKLLSTVRLYDVLHVGTPSTTQVAFLADWAMRKGAEWPDEMPAPAEVVQRAFDLVDDLYELAVIREAVLADRRTPDQAHTEVGE